MRKEGMECDRGVKTSVRLDMWESSKMLATGATLLYCSTVS